MELDGLTPAQTKAVMALVEGKSVVTSAKRAGVARSTVHRWLSQPEFTQALRQAEATLIDSHTRRLLALTDRALDLMAAVISDPAATYATRLRACGMVLDAMLRLRELRNVEERLAELERAVLGNGEAD